MQWNVNDTLDKCGRAVSTLIGRCFGCLRGKHDYQVASVLVTDLVANFLGAPVGHQTIRACRRCSARGMRYVGWIHGGAQYREEDWCPISQLEHDEIKSRWIASARLK